MRSTHKTQARGQGAEQLSPPTLLAALRGSGQAGWGLRRASGWFHGVCHANRVHSWMPAQAKGRIWGWAGTKLLEPGAGYRSTVAVHPGLKKATHPCVHRPANIHTPGWAGHSSTQGWRPWSIPRHIPAMAQGCDICVYPEPVQQL